MAKVIREIILGRDLEGNITESIEVEEEEFDEEYVESNGFEIGDVYFYFDVGAENGVGTKIYLDDRIDNRLMTYGLDFDNFADALEYANDNELINFDDYWEE